MDLQCGYYSRKYDDIGNCRRLVDSQDGTIVPSMLRNTKSCFVTGVQIRCIDSCQGSLRFSSG